MSVLPQSTPPRSADPAERSGPPEGAAATVAATGIQNPQSPVLSAEHYAQLAAAHLAFASIRRALRVVTFSASTLALFAVLSLPFALFSLKAAFVAAGLVAAAVFEFRGRAAMGRLELAGVKTLVRNQIALTAVMAIYCLWSMAAAWFGPDLYAEISAREPAVGELLAPYSELFRQAATGLYGIVLLVGLIVQAFVIRYYATRRQHIQRYLADTPAWILAWNRS